MKPPAGLVVYRPYMEHVVPPPPTPKKFNRMAYPPKPELGVFRILVRWDASKESKPSSQGMKENVEFCVDRVRISAKNIGQGPEKAKERVIEELEVGGKIKVLRYESVAKDIDVVFEEKAETLRKEVLAWNPECCHCDSCL